MHVLAKIFVRDFLITEPSFWQYKLQLHLK